ncbi:MAG TPA: hypothetical protein VLS49_11265 [Usitatibacter sp.]|nr:hypothetical protein [Usitatibacter sp.]
MRAFPQIALLLAALAALGTSAARAERETVCTVTVNSADERETFRRNLPAGQFDFVELVEHGRRDWLRSACERKVRCDILVVSGHFAGTEFYSSRPETNETLPVDEMERAACGACPDLFSHLKEVYLFGCDSLKPDAPKSAAPEIVRGLVAGGESPAEAQRLAKDLSRREGEDARDRMRRIFAGVPVIYGFASLAPYGRTAGPLLQRYFDTAPGGEIGSGRVSERLLALFARSSMVATRGIAPDDPDFGDRARACRFYGEHPAAERLEALRGELSGDMPHVRMAFDRAERFFAALAPAERADPAFAAALDAMARDAGLRARYLSIERATQDPALRVRMISLARTVGWLSPKEQQAELGRTIVDVLARRSMAFGDVELVCTLNGDRALDAVRGKLHDPPGLMHAPAQSAGLACLGSVDARSRVLRLLASPNEGDVQVAQAYLRHRPITDPAELRAVAAGIAAMKPGPAQVRALDALGRMHVADAKVLDALAALFARTPSLAVQRAIAEAFLRSDPQALARPALAKLFRAHRLRSPDGEDLIDVLVRRLS